MPCSTDHHDPIPRFGARSGNGVISLIRAKRADLNSGWSLGAILSAPAMAHDVPAAARLAIDPVQARARVMKKHHGGDAYYLARDRARRPGGRRVWFWTRVAIEIARLDGRVIGLSVSDRQ